MKKEFATQDDQVEFIPGLQRKQLPGSTCQTMPLDLIIYAALEQQFLPLDQQNFDALVIEVDQEKERILKALEVTNDVEQYIQTRQRQLVRLIDLMSLHCTKQDVYMYIYKSLRELLNFLERDFACYLDENCKVPFPYLLMTQELVMKEVETIEHGFSATGIDPELSELVLRPFYDLLAIEDHDFLYSYHEIFYLKNLYQQLNRKIETEEELQELLMRYNFNDPEYFMYLTDQIRGELNEMPSVNTKKDMVMLLIRDVDQLPVDPGMCLDKLRKSLKQQLLSWLSKELSYLEKFEANVVAPGELDLWKDFKVQTNLSVPQLGRLIGLLLEQGIILNSNKKELALFFSVFFTSVQTDYIAAGSLRISFYDKSISLARSLHVLLKKLIAVLSQQ